MDTNKGTINIMLFFNCSLSPAALTRSIVTLTEAKSAALAENARMRTALAKKEARKHLIKKRQREPPENVDAKLWRAWCKRREERKRELLPMDYFHREEEEAEGEEGKDEKT